MDRYQNREAAGKVLAQHLQHYKNHPDTIVLALPRGGVPVAYEVANSIHAPLDVFIVRKLGVPGHEELAFGAIAMGGVTVFNEEIMRDLTISEEVIKKVIAEEQKELNRRQSAYRAAKPFPSLTHRNVILVDDGIATGATMRAAIQSLRALKAKKIIVAVPVAESGMCQTMTTLVDEFICPLRPVYFNAVGAWYEDFSQTTDEEVYTLLSNASRPGLL